MPSTQKEADNLWSVTVEDAPDGVTLTASKAGRNYEVCANGEPIGEARTLDEVAEVAAAWTARWWAEASAGTASPAAVDEAASGGESSPGSRVYDPPVPAAQRAARMWLEEDPGGGWNIVRQWEGGRMKVLRRVAGPRHDAEIALYELMEFERGQGVAVIDGAPRAD